MWSKSGGLWHRIADSSVQRVGLLYLLTCTLYALIGLVAAVAIQFDMMTPVRQLLGTLWFGKLLTGHGMLMLFLVLLPLFPGAFGHLVFVTAVGASRTVTSRVGYLGWLCHLGGGILIIISLFMNAYDGGWMMLMPAAGRSVPYVLLLIGLQLAALATLLPSLAVVYIALSKRVRTVATGQFPLIAWFLLLGVLVQIVVTPIRLITLIALLGGHAWGWSWVSLTAADGITRYEQLFWLYTGPASLGLVLPAIGILFEVLMSHSRARVNARTTVVSCGIGMLLLTLASWSQHLVATADGELSALVGSLLGALLMLPASIVLLQWLRLLARIKGPVSAVVLFAFSSIVCLVLTAIAGVGLAVPAIAIHLHNTYYTVAHLHLAMGGAIGGAIMAALFHFWPQRWQTMYSEPLARISAIGLLAGTGFTFLPLLLLGAQGLPQALYVYPVQFRTLHVVSSIGTILLVASLLLASFTLAHRVLRRRATSETIAPAAGELGCTSIWHEAAGRS